jgi:hypothetical protein
MTHTLDTKTPKRGDTVTIPARMGTTHTGRVIRVVRMAGYYDPRVVTRYYRVEGYPLLVADVELVAR